MSVFKVNHGEAGDFKPLPSGLYELICTKAEHKKAQQTGNPMLALELTVRNDVQQAGANRKVFHNLVFTEKSQGIVQSALKAFGVPDGKEYNTYQEIAADLLYKPVRAKLIVEAYRDSTGKDRETNRVHYFEPSQAGTPANVATSSDPFATDDIDPTVADDLPF